MMSSRELSFTPGTAWAGRIGDPPGGVGAVLLFGGGVGSWCGGGTGVGCWTGMGSAAGCGAGDEAAAGAAGGAVSASGDSDAIIRRRAVVPPPLPLIRSDRGVEVDWTGSFSVDAAGAPRFSRRLPFRSGVAAVADNSDTSEVPTMTAVESASTLFSTLRALLLPFLLSAASACPAPWSAASLFRLSGAEDPDGAGALGEGGVGVSVSVDACIEDGEAFDAGA